MSKRKIKPGKAVRWFPEDATEEEINDLLTQVAIPTQEDINLATSAWEAIKDRYQKLLEAKLKEDARP